MKSGARAPRFSAIFSPLDYSCRTSLLITFTPFFKKNLVGTISSKIQCFLAFSSEQHHHTFILARFQQTKVDAFGFLHLFGNGAYAAHKATVHL
jgi:hypothetical protein